MALVLREDESREQEFDDIETEFGLHGLETPVRRVLPEVTRFAQRFPKERKRNPDPAALDRFNDELDALCDRLMAGDRAVMAE